MTYQFSPARLLATRKSRGLTQAALAATAEVGADTLADYENGVTAPNARVLGRLADALRCHITDFYFDENDVWARDLVASLPPLTNGQIAAAARVFAQIDGKAA